LRLFLGSECKFLNFFIADETAFLDLPAFEFPDGKLTADAELLGRIRQATHLAGFG
jgi:hypothetical protein